MSMVGVAAGIIFHSTGGRRIRMFVAASVNNQTRPCPLLYIPLEAGLLGPSSLQATCMQLRKDEYTGIS